MCRHASIGRKTVGYRLLFPYSRIEAAFLGWVE